MWLQIIKSIIKLIVLHKSKIVKAYKYFNIFIVQCKNALAIVPIFVHMHMVYSNICFIDKSDITSLHFIGILLVMCNNYLELKVMQGNMLKYMK